MSAILTLTSSQRNDPAALLIDHGNGVRVLCDDLHAHAWGAHHHHIDAAPIALAGHVGALNGRHVSVDSGGVRVRALLECGPGPSVAGGDVGEKRCTQVFFACKYYSRYTVTVLYMRLETWPVLQKV